MADRRSFNLLPITSKETVIRARDCELSPLCLIASYPKSGTTWMQAIVRGILMGFHPTAAHISEFTPFLDADATWSKLNNGEFSENFRKMEMSCFNTHFLPNMLPWHDGVKVVYVVRNGRDVATSFFHHLSNQKIGQGESADFVGELEHFLDQWSNGLLPYGLWASHVAEWVRESKLPSRSSMILIMKYEDMRLDLEGCILKVATFLGKPLSAEFASELAAKLDFSSMKAEVEMYQPLSVRWREGFSFVRAGASGTVFEPKAEAIFQRAITTESIEDRLSIEELGLI